MGVTNETIIFLPTFIFSTNHCPLYYFPSLPCIHRGLTNGYLFCRSSERPLRLVISLQFSPKQYYLIHFMFSSSHGIKKITASFTSFLLCTFHVSSPTSSSYKLSKYQWNKSQQSDAWHPALFCHALLPTSLPNWQVFHMLYCNSWDQQKHELHN